MLNKEHFHLKFDCDLVIVFIFEIGERNWVSCNYKRIQITNRRWVDPNPSHPDGGNKKTTAVGKPVRVLLTTYGLIREIRDTLIGGILPVQWTLMNVRTS